jgi:hypothetical protein
MRARIFYCNTHAGQAIFQGGVSWAVDQFDPDISVLVEVGRIRARLAMVQAFPRKDWSITGLRPIHALLVESGSHIMAKKDVFKRKSWSNKFLTGQAWIHGRRDKWHPVRRLTRAVLVFRNHPEVELEVAADHTWTLHNPNQAPDVGLRHRHQVVWMKNDASKATRSGRAHIRVGDYNEPIEAPSKTFVELQFVEVGLKLLVASHLDGLFGNRHITVLSHEVIPKERLHTDHDGLIIDVEVR